MGFLTSSNFYFFSFLSLKKAKEDFVLRNWSQSRQLLLKLIDLFGKAVFFHSS